MSGPRRLIIHIGLEKTGTSSLQAFLHRNDAILRRHSVLYPKRNRAYGWENHKPLVGCYGIDDVGDKWVAMDPSKREATVASLVGEIEGSRERTAVISAEHFSSRFRERHIEALRADFARFDCTIVVVLRDHVARLCSAYDSYVTNGGMMYIEDFAEQMIRPDALDMRYAELIAPWERVFGRDRLALVGYGADTVRQVLATISPALAAEPGLPAYRLRQSSRPDVVAALRLANDCGAFGLESTSTWARHNVLRGQIKAWLQASARETPSCPWWFEGDLSKRLTETVEDDLARLEERYGFVPAPPEPGPQGEGYLYDEAAALLARALVARAAKPWTRASLLGAGLGAATALREKTALIRRRPSRST